MKMRYVILFLGIVGIMALITGCAKTNSKDNSEGTEMEKTIYKQISQEEAKNLMDTEKDYIILDVRTQEEFGSGHITGAICIPNETIIDAEPSELPDKNQLILVYCRSGNRSKQASQKLADMGYTNIQEFGGIITWSYGIE